MPDVIEKDSEGITLKLKINLRFIERLFFIVIIVVLAVFAFNSTFSDGSCEAVEEKTQEDLTGAVAQDTEEKEEAAEVVEIKEEPEVNETEEANITTQVEEVNETTEVNETEEEENVSYSGKVELTINEVIYETRNEGTYGKVTGVRFTINNEKKDFMPKVEVYAYEDGDTSSVFATKPREERVYSTLKLGRTNSYELSIASQQFPDLDEYIICKVRILDKSTDDILVTAEKKFKIS